MRGLSTVFPSPVPPWGRPPRTRMASGQLPFLAISTPVRQPKYPAPALLSNQTFLPHLRASAHCSQHPMLFEIRSHAKKYMVSLCPEQRDIPFRSGFAISVAPSPAMAATEDAPPVEGTCLLSARSPSLALPTKTPEVPILGRHEGGRSARPNRRYTLGVSV